MYRREQSKQQNKDRSSPCWAVFALQYNDDHPWQGALVAAGEGAGARAARGLNGRGQGCLWPAGDGARVAGADS